MPVLYGIPAYIDKCLLLCVPDKKVEIVQKEYIRHWIENDYTRSTRYGYHIPWQHIYNLTIKILCVNKKVFIKEIKVPSVDLFTKQLRNKK